MKRTRWLLSLGLLAAFILWTLLVCFADVQPIGPEGSSVGLATINRFVHQLTGVHFALYTLTDWLGLVPIGVCIGFGILGLKQWLQRQSLRKVDRSLLALGLFYIVVMAVYAFFEVCVINRRPVLIDGILEASYPSSTTLLVMCVMPTVSMHLSARMKKTYRLDHPAVYGFHGHWQADFRRTLVQRHCGQHAAEFRACSAVQNPQS